MALESHEDSRLRKVEEAIIEFRNIAKVVIVDLKERVRLLEKHNEIASSAIETKMAAVASKASSNTATISLLLFSLFCGALLYFNAQVGTLHEKINTGDRELNTKISNYYANTLVNNNKLDNVVHSLNGIAIKMDKIISQQTPITEKGIE